VKEGKEVALAGVILLHREELIMDRMNLAA